MNFLVNLEHNASPICYCNWCLKLKLVFTSTTIGLDEETPRPLTSFDFVCRASTGLFKSPNVHLPYQRSQTNLENLIYVANALNGSNNETSSSWSGSTAAHALERNSLRTKSVEGKTRKSHSKKIRCILVKESPDRCILV